MKNKKMRVPATGTSFGVQCPAGASNEQREHIRTWITKGCQDFEYVTHRFVE